MIQPTLQTVLHTVNDVLEAVNALSTSLDERMNQLDGRMDHQDSHMNQLDGRMDQFGSRLIRVEALMVTKDYLDDKLADLRGDFVLLTRAEDHKLGSLIGVLVQEGRLSKGNAQKILALEPFPHIK